jgi:hypothetical protein
MDTDQDRFPEPREVLDRVVNDEGFPEGPFERLEIWAMASGECTWRVWAPREDEPVGGAITDLGDKP